MATMKIGQLADRTGVGVETIRFYEREGLLPPPPRNASGYRVYPPETADRVTFILRAKTLGFTLEEVRELLMLRVDAEATCGEIKDMAQEKIAVVEEKIAALTRMRDTLLRLVADCGESRRSAEECPILASFSGQGVLPGIAPGGMGGDKHE